MTFARIDHAVGAALRTIAILCAIAIFLLVLAMVFGRSSGLFNPSWSGEIIEFLFAWMVFIGAAALWRERGHFLVENPLQSSTRPVWRIYQAILALLGLAFFLIFAAYSGRLVLLTTATTPILQLPSAWSYLAMPVAGALMALYAVRDLIVIVAKPKSRHPEGRILPEED
jgi:TRAP-type transport system small permease protein